MLQFEDGSTIREQEPVRPLYMEDAEQMETTSKHRLIVKVDAAVRF